MRFKNLTTCLSDQQIYYLLDYYFFPSSLSQSIFFGMIIGAVCWFYFFPGDNYSNSQNRQEMNSFIGWLLGLEYLVKQISCDLKQKKKDLKKIQAILASLEMYKEQIKRLILGIHYLLLDMIRTYSHTVKILPHSVRGLDRTICKMTVLF